MALKLLQPSLRPLGQFDLADSSATIKGGEVVKLASSAIASDEAAADSHQVGPLLGSAATNFANFTAGTFANGTLCGLADDGDAGYGTQFGTLIGTNAGKGVQVPTSLGATLSGGAVVIGPETHAASGKVTVWHAAGLYSVNADALATTANTADAILLSGQPTLSTVDAETTQNAADIDADTTVNSLIFAQTTTGKLYTVAAPSAVFHMRGGVAGAGAGSRSDQCAIYAGYISDSSLVSTPSTLAGIGTVDAEEYAIYFLGNQGLI
jgi:hypothetical protein